MSVQLQYLPTAKNSFDVIKVKGWHISSGDWCESNSNRIMQKNKMTTIAYLHDGTSVYDELFLKHLVKKNRVYFLTFKAKPRFVPKGTNVVTMQEPLRLADKEWFEGIRMYTLFLLRSLLIKLHIRRLKPHVVIGCMATKYGFYLAIAGFKPTILIVWGSDVLLAPKRFFLFRFMSKYALKKADAIILDSQVQQEAIIQLGCNPSRILKFPWFDLEDAHVENSRDEVREKLGWKDNTIIINARSHEPIYGVEYLIEAIPEVVRKEPKSRFLILGQGTLTKNLKQRVEQLQISEYVKFTGRVTRAQTFTYLNASDINVSTSFSDGTSASLLEAMILAVPSVVTQIPGNEEWIEDGENGYLIPIRDSKSLAEKIVFLIRNNESRKKLGENARKTVGARVHWRENMKVFDKLIQKLIEEA